MELKDLRAKRAGLVDKLAKLHGDIGEKSPTKEQQEGWDGLKAELSTVDGAIQRAEEVEALKTSTAKTITPPGTPGAPGVLRGAQPSTEKGHMFARICRTFAAAGNNMDAAVKMAKDAEDGALLKALNSSEPVGAGLWVDVQYAEEFIDLLRAREVVTPNVDDTRPLPNGLLPFRRGTSDATAQYTGEGQGVLPSQPSVGQMTLVSREMKVLCGIDNNMLRRAGPRVDAWALNAMLNAAKLRKDLALIRGDGSNNTPRGLRSFAEEAGNLFEANATVNLDNIDADTNKLLNALLGKNVQMLKPGWLCHPQTKIRLGSLRNDLGAKVFPEIDEKGIYRGFPIFDTTQMPINLGSGGMDTEFGLVDFSACVIGEETDIIVSMSNEATYWDGQQWQSAFQNGETLVQLQMAHDFNMKHIEAVAFLTGVKWR